MKRLLVALSLLFMVSNLTMAQDYVRLGNGNTVKGQLIENGSMVRIVNSAGDTFSFPRTQIAEIKVGGDIALPNPSKRPQYTHYSDLDAGWWISVEIGAGLAFSDDESSIAPEARVSTGYRFSEFLRVGLAFSPRLTSSDIQLPIMLEARGNMFSDRFRMFAPYWNFGIGYTPNCGLTIAPEVGMRIGLPRHAFLFSIGYAMQQMESPKASMNLVGLKIGYEF